MEPWKQMLADNSDLAAVMDEDATFTLRLTAEEFVDWYAFASMDCLLDETCRPGTPGL